MGADPFTIAAMVAMTAGSAYSGYEQREARKDAEASMRDERTKAEIAQKKQEALAKEELRTASSKMKESHLRLIKGQKKQTLFGSELGTQDNLKSTLGA